MLRRSLEVRLPSSLDLDPSAEVVTYFIITLIFKSNQSVTTRLKEVKEVSSQIKSMSFLSHPSNQSIQSIYPFINISIHQYINQLMN